MAESIPHLYKVRDTYYFRVRIPRDIAHHFNGKQDLKRSLGTKSLKQARRLLKVKSYRAEEVFTTMRSGILTDEQIRRLADAYLHDTLREYEEERAAGHRAPKDREGLDSALEMNADEEGDTREALALNNIAYIENEVRAYLAAYHNLEIDPESLEFKKLAREILKHRLEINRIENERICGYYANGYDDRPHVSTTAIPSGDATAYPSASPGKALPLSEVIEKYITAEYRDTGKASEHSVNEYEYQCRFFQEAMGNKEITAVTRDDIREFLKLLKRYPKNANKLKQYRDKTLTEITAMEIPVGETMSDTTIHKYMKRVHTFFTWAVNEKYCKENPASGIQHVWKKAAGKEEHYQPFDKEELAGMVRGFLTVAETGELAGKPERIWLPLLALFTGARANELAQLHIGDVRQEKETGIWFLRIEADAEGTKRVKNRTSIRDVPIHPKLLDLGFLEYYRAMEAQGAPRLWMNLTETKKGYYRNFSNWFLKSPIGPGFKNLYITTHPKKVFHSFRDTLITEMMRKHVPLSLIQNTVGHTHGNITFDVYGSKGHTLQAKLEALQAMDYGVDLCPLKAILADLR